MCQAEHLVKPRRGPDKLWFSKRGAFPSGVSSSPPNRPQRPLGTPQNSCPPSGRLLLRGLGLPPVHLEQN